MVHLCYITNMKLVLMCMVLWVLSEFQAISLAQNNTTTDPAASMEKQLADVIKRLDSENWSDRETASKDLRKLRQSFGAPLIQILQMQINTVPPETKIRIMTEISHFQELLKMKDQLSAIDYLLPQDNPANIFVFNTGNLICINNAPPAFEYVYGWILAEDDDIITVFAIDLATRTFPKGSFSPPSPEALEKTQPENMPIPGHYKSIPLSIGINEALQKKLNDHTAEVLNNPKYELPLFMEMAVYAYWALQINDENTAFKFFEFANNAWLNEKNNFREDLFIVKNNMFIFAEEDNSFNKSLKRQTAELLKAKAISSANTGMPREKLVKKWEFIRNLTGSEESAEMISLYKQLIAEDKAWIEPDKLTIDAMRPENKVSYWLYKLRDCNMSHTQVSWIISTRIDFSLPPAVQEFPEPGVKDPFDELFKLDWHAIPSLIDHLHDARPTRAIKTKPISVLRQANRISFFPELLNYGDCCHLILENIINRSLSKDYVIETLYAIAEENTTVEIKHYSVRTLGRFRYQRAAEILITFLDDTTTTDFTTQLRTCDEAFYSLALIFRHIPELHEIITSINTASTAKDTSINSMKSWWVQNKDRLDWENIRKQAEYEESFVDGYVLPPLNHLTK